MWERGLISLAIIVSVCVASIAFLPVGAGPYTAVYGPTSALRAQRAFLLLIFAVAFIGLLAAVPASTILIFPGAVVPAAGIDQEVAVLSSLTCALRC